MRYFSALLLALLLSVQGSDEADIADELVCNEESDKCGPQYLLQTGARAKRDVKTEAVEDSPAAGDEDHPEDAAAWEKVTTFSGKLDDCIAEMSEGATDARKGALALVRDAEVQQKAFDLGLVKDHSIVDAAVMAGKTAAAQIVLEDFNTSLMSAMGGQNLTSQVIDNFVNALKNLATACNDSSEAEQLSEDERALMTNTNEHMSETEAAIAFDLAYRVQLKCQEEALDLNWFFHHASSITSPDVCGPMTQDAFLERARKEAKGLDLHAQTVLALHNEDNQLGHHFVNNLQHVSDGLYTEKEFDAAQTDKVREALLSKLSKPALARLRYLDKKHFTEEFGGDKQQWCAQYDAVKAAKPDIFLMQSDAVSKVRNCLCVEDEISFICQARYYPELLEVKSAFLKHVEADELKEKEEEKESPQQLTKGNSSAIFPGPCKDVIVGFACIGNNCIDTTGGVGIDVFNKIRELFQGPSSCFSAGINFNFGWPGVQNAPPGADCIVKLRLQLHVTITSCASIQDIMLTFHIGLKLQLCLGTDFAAFLAKLGIYLCITLVDLRYYTFIGKLTGELNIPVWTFIIGIRAVFKMGGPVHALTKPVQAVINNANNDWWARNAFRAACPGCRGTSAAALVQEEDELVAEGEDAQNVGFWRRRRRRRRRQPPRRRRTHCQTSQCNGGSSKAYWQTKFNQARGGFYIELSGQIMKGVCFPWVGCWGEWHTFFRWRHDR